MHVLAENHRRCALNPFLASRSSYPYHPERHAPLYRDVATFADFWQGTYEPSKARYWTVESNRGIGPFGTFTKNQCRSA